MSRWFDEYCGNAEHETGEDGWPVPIPLLIADALREALGHHNPSDIIIEQAAARIYSASKQGQGEQQPRNRPASGKASVAELRKMQDLAARLADHIDGMHAPANSQLMREGLMAGEFVQRLREAQETGQHAASMIEDAPSPRGRPPSVEAAAVTECAANFFHQITGKPPTRSVDGGEYGEWIDTLRNIFAVLRISESPEKQAQTHRTEIGKRQAT